MYVQYDLASPSLRAKNFYFVQPSFAPGVIGSFYHAETTGMHGPDAAETKQITQGVHSVCSVLVNVRSRKPLRRAGIIYSHSG